MFSQLPYLATHIGPVMFLGTKATVVIPMAGATKVDPKPGIIDMYGKRLEFYRDHCRESTNIAPLTDPKSQITPSILQMDWLEAATVEKFKHI